MGGVGDVWFVRVKSNTWRERERREGGSKDSNNHAGSMQGPKDTISNQDIVPEA